MAWVKAMRYLLLIYPLLAVIAAWESSVFGKPAATFGSSVSSSPQKCCAIWALRSRS